MSFFPLQFLRSLGQMALLIATISTASGLAAQEAAAPPATPRTRPAPLAPLSEPIALAHILLAYKGAKDAPLEITRDREAARREATRVLREVRAPGSDFQTLIERYTDDQATIPIQGRFITLVARAELPEFEEIMSAALALKIGDVSDVVASPMGFHILKRTPVIEFAASHILIRYQGARDAPPTLKRTREEAFLHAQQVFAEVRAVPAEFASMATKHSEGTTARQGGSLGTFAGGNTIRELEAAIAEIGEGEITGPVESPWGFHIVKRDPVLRLRASHILVTYRDAPRRPKEVTRGREEALAFIGLLKVRLDGGDAKFADLAREHSDDPKTAESGGDIGLVRPGQAEQRLVDAVTKLKLGEITSMIETPYGFHLIQRTE